MKELIKYSAFLIALFLVLGCNDDDDLRTIQLNEPFTAVFNQKYICNTVDGDIVIEITNIEDRRVRGNSDCDVVTYPGEAIVHVNVSMDNNEYSDKLNYFGCTVIEGSPEDPALPSLELEKGYIVRMFDISPYSPRLTPDDKLSLEDYQMRFVIIK